MQDIQITVYVGGGTVQGVDCSHPDLASHITLHVIDFDTEGTEAQAIVNGRPAFVSTMSLADAPEATPDIEPVAS